MTRLMQRTISRNSAEQRSSRLGKLEQEASAIGCIRKNNTAMTAALQPEILCMPLTLAILKFLEMGLSNPHKFEFIERPANETLDGALATLTKLGAVANYRLTEFGDTVS
jgi:HrpA-like RNA helicase